MPRSRQFNVYIVITRANTCVCVCVCVCVCNVFLWDPDPVVRRLRNYTAVAIVLHHLIQYRRTIADKSISLFDPKDSKGRDAMSQ